MKAAAAEIFPGKLEWKKLDTFCPRCQKLVIFKDAVMRNAEWT